MPSFHFTLFFAVASVYSNAYDDALWPYGLAAVGLASNIRGHNHWVSDMIAGALIGTAIGNVLTAERFDDDGRLQLAPFMDSQGAGLVLSLDF